MSCPPTRQDQSDLGLPPIVFKSIRHIGCDPVKNLRLYLKLLDHFLDVLCKTLFKRTIPCGNLLTSVTNLTHSINVAITSTSIDIIF